MDQNETLFDILWIIAFTLSLFSSILLCLSLRKKKTNYAKLMRYISISEAIFIFVEFIFVCDKILKEFKGFLQLYFKKFVVFEM